MAGLIITCCRCLREYEPDRSDIIRGYAHWSRCPDCRAPVTLPRLPTSKDIDYGGYEDEGPDEAA